jgi:hypothetical protein
MRTLNAIVAVCFVAGCLAGVANVAGLGCSGGQVSSEWAEALRALPAALDAAEDALEAVRPILTHENLGLSEAERAAVEDALDAMTGVLELGRALSRDLARATDEGGWAWARAALSAIASIAKWLKAIGVPIPDAVVGAANAAELLLPTLTSAVSAADGA